MSATEMQRLVWNMVVDEKFRRDFLGGDRAPLAAKFGLDEGEREFILSAHADDAVTFYRSVEVFLAGRGMPRPVWMEENKSE